MTLDLNNVPPLREYDDSDDEEVMHRLRERAPEWVPVLFPRGRRSFDGKEWRVANIHGAPPKKEGSCKINLDGDNAGDWYDFSLSKGGGPVSTIKETTGLSGAALMERMREYAGMPLRQAPSRAIARRSDVDRSLDVAFILKMCAKPAETVVETYLRSRGLDLPPTEDIKFHSSLTDWNDRTAPIGRPAMVAIVRRPDTGEATGGVHRTYLAEDGSRKADVAKPKMMLGPCDGVVMLMPMGADGSLGVSEGIESGLAAHKLFGVPTWATLSTSGMRNFVFPPGLKRLAIFADRGADGEGTAFHLRERALARGIDASVTLPRSDDDFAKDLALGLRQDNTREDVIPPIRRLADIMVAANALTRPHQGTQLSMVLRGVVAAQLNTIERDQVFAVIKRKAGVGKTDLIDMLKETRREVTSAARAIGPRPAWADKLILWDNGEPKPTLANALIPLREDEALTGLVGHNEFTEGPTLQRKPPYDCGDRPMTGIPLPWSNDDTLRLTEWMQMRGVNATPDIVMQAVTMVARETAFHPIREWLEGLKWDGRGRLNDWLQTHVGAADTPYTRAVGSRYLISAVARIYRPGCKVDCALILEGKQGIGKSTLLRSLFDPWFTDEIADLGTKDSAMQLLGVWSIELAELDALDRVEVRRIKSWISRTDDHYRPPYGRTVIDVPRQCVFCGSTNDSGYLRDPSGGRRFWPIKCSNKKVNIKAFYEVREQLWAEALSRFRSNEIWDLREDNLVEAAKEEQADRYEGDVWDPEMAEWLHRRFPPNQYNSDGYDKVRIGEVLDGAIGLEKSRWTRSDELRVIRFLKVNGWERWQQRNRDQSREWLYRRPHPRPVNP